MTYSFYSNQKTMLLAFGMMLCTLCSCNQSKPQPQEQGVSKEELAAMLDSVKAAAKEEAKAEFEKEAEEKASEESNAPESSYSSESTSSTNSSSSNVKSPAEAAYKQGYDRGMLHHTMRLNFYTENNEKQLKNEYMQDSRIKSIGIGEENYNNREIYNEYRRGFFKGYEDGNNAL